MPTIPKGATLPEYFTGVELDRTRFRSGGADPVTLSPDLIEAAYHFAARGNPRAFICRSLGVSRRTWYKWLSAGQAEVEALDRWFEDGEDGPQPRVTLRAALFSRVEQGEGESVDRILVNVLAEGTPRDQLRLLEIRHARHFNANPSQVVDDETGEAEKADGVTVFDALLGKLEALRSNMGEGEGGDA